MAALRPNFLRGVSHGRAGKWSLPQVLQARQYSDAVSGESRTCPTVFLTPLQPHFYHEDGGRQGPAPARPKGLRHHPE
jgi:hypothetical protein